MYARRVARVDHVHLPNELGTRSEAHFPLHRELRALLERRDAIGSAPDPLLDLPFATARSLPYRHGM